MPRDVECGVAYWVHDLIANISTLGHIGWDEKPRYPEKVLSAFENLRALLDTQGKMVAMLHR